MHDRLVRQMSQQGPAGRPRLLRHGARPDLGRILRLARLDLLQRQLQLADGALDPLRRGAEARPLQKRQLRLEHLDQRVPGL